MLRVMEVLTGVLRLFFYFSCGQMDKSTKFFLAKKMCEGQVFFTSSYSILPTRFFFILYTKIDPNNFTLK